MRELVCPISFSLSFCYGVRSGDKLADLWIIWIVLRSSIQIRRRQRLYREAVMTSSPTLPLGGYVGYRHMKWTQPHRGCDGLEFDTQGSRGGNPGLEVETASRYSSIGAVAGASVHW